MRAVNAVKLDKIFAKPFIGSLTGHSDGVWCTCTSPKSLVVPVCSFLALGAIFVRCLRWRNSSVGLAHPENRLSHSSSFSLCSRLGL